MQNYQKIQFSKSHRERPAFDWWKMVEREMEENKVGDCPGINTWEEFVGMIFQT